MYHNDAQKETMLRMVQAAVQSRLRRYRARKYGSAAAPLDTTLFE